MKHLLKGYLAFLLGMGAVACAPTPTPEMATERAKLEVQVTQAVAEITQQALEVTAAAVAAQSTAAQKNLAAQATVDALKATLSAPPFTTPSLTPSLTPSPTYNPVLFEGYFTADNYNLTGWGAAGNRDLNVIAFPSKFSYVLYTHDNYCLTLGLPTKAPITNEDLYFEVELSVISNESSIYLGVGSDGTSYLLGAGGSAAGSQVGSSSPYYLFGGSQGDFIRFISPTETLAEYPHSQLWEVNKLFKIGLEILGGNYTIYFNDKPYETMPLAIKGRDLAVVFCSASAKPDYAFIQHTIVKTSR